MGIDNEVTPEIIQAVLPYIDNLRIKSDYTPQELQQIIARSGTPYVVVLNDGKNITNLRNIKKDNPEIIVGLSDLSRKQTSKTSKSRI